MSQSNKDKLSTAKVDNGKEVENARKALEDAKKSYLDKQERALDDVEKGLNDVEKSLNDVNGASSSKRPAEAISSKGYNSMPQGSLDTSQDTRHPGLSRKNSLNDSSKDNTEEEGKGRSNPRESAPDIGKDYGDSLEPGYNGYNPYGQNGQNDVAQPSDDKKIEKNAPSEASQEEAAKKTQEDVENGAKKADELDKKKNGEDNPELSKTQGDDKKSEQSTTPDETSQQRNNNVEKNSVPKDKDPEAKEDEEPSGNGYGALRRNYGKKNQNRTSDPTKNAKSNLEHDNKSKQENKPRINRPKTTTSGGGAGLLSNLGLKAKQGLKNFFNRSKNEVSDGDGSGEKQDNSFMGNLMNKVMRSLLSNPYVLIALGVVLLFIIIILATMDDELGGGGGRGRKTCTYNLSGVTATGSVELSNLKVEIVNCDATESNYTVLETVDFEKYILGVALAEAGPSSPNEALKAQMIAVRNFTLTRNSGMCPGNPDNCFHGYNASTGIIRMRACTNDQVYWDYDKDIYQQTRADQPSLYSPEVNSGTVWKTALSESRKAELEALSQEVLGEVLIDDSGNVLKLGYQKDETDKFIELANSGKTYTEILEEVYGSSQYSSASCKYGNFDYGDYELTSEGHTILHEPLDRFLEKNGTSLEEFNELIAGNVEDAGYGTRAGVVAAAVTLIAELGNNYGVKVPYYWGGGHYDGVVVGALGYWGSTECHTYANGQSYDYCGFDCSGFVPWAIKNGGFNKGVGLASDFQYMDGARRVNLTNSPVMQPGDLLESEGHVILIVGIDEEAGQYICAEAMGNAYGTLFSRRSFTESGYWGVDLEDYYNNPSNVRSQ